METLPSLPAIDETVTISVDYERVRTATQQERDSSMTTLFLALTNALNKGYEVDMRDLTDIKVRKK